MASGSVLIRHPYRAAARGARAARSAAPPLAILNTISISTVLPASTDILGPL
jgi:hypothetical protein